MNIPFICHNLPIVRTKGLSTYPLVDGKRPFISFCKNPGFTLIELLTVLAVIGVLAVIAAPAITTFVNSNRLTTTTNDFIGALSLARSEAIKRGFNAGVCKSDNGSTCTSTGTWDSGWLVFVDGDNNGALPWTASDSMIRAHEAVPLGVALTVVTGSDAITYSRQGLVLDATPTALEYRLCNSKINKSRTVTVTFAGRASLSESTCP